MDKVFGIHELNKQIILSLPQSEVLIAAATCKSWRHMIETSKAIRKHLAAVESWSSIPAGDAHKDNIWIVSCYECRDQNGTLLVRRQRALEMRVWVPAADDELLTIVDRGEIHVTRQGLKWFIRLPGQSVPLLVSKPLEYYLRFYCEGEA